MKWRMVIGFGIGVALGWGLPGQTPVDRKQAAEIHAAEKLASEPADPSVPGSGPHDSGHVPVERLMELVDSDQATALSVADIMTGNDRPLDALAAWARLDAGQKAELARILREAVDERLAWESANVRVEQTAPGHWVLDFPGDKGLARKALRERIESAFPPETAAAIQLAGDLDHFHGFGSWDPEFRHGRVTARVLRSSAIGEADPDGKFLLVLAKTEQSTLESSRGIDDYRNDYRIGRLARLLGPETEVLEAATEAAR